MDNQSNNSGQTQDSGANPAAPAAPATPETPVATEEQEQATFGIPGENVAAEQIDAATATAAPQRSMEDINREFQEQATLKKAKEFQLPYINLGVTPINPDYLKIIPFESARKARIAPFFKVGVKVRVAVEDHKNPETVKVIEDLKAQGLQVDVVLASTSGIDDVLKIYSSTIQYKEKQIVETIEEKSIGTYEKEIESLADIPKKLKEITAEEGLNMLNIGAMKTNASDIHYEPSESTVEVRYRIDGILHKVFELEVDTYKNLANQIKYESKMQLNITTVPQDGRYTFNFNQQKIGVRVSSIPTPFGESFVCRFLAGGSKEITFEELGFQDLALTKLKNACKISQGMILVTGPTGSGKSTTLYAVLQKMNTPENKIITLEDPVEYPILGVTQSQIDEKKKYTFSSGLRAILRQDPDIVMIGEIRDLDTAQTCSQAALTGHVLLSTLHTNSAIESIPRLINMGLPAFMVAPALNTILAQRLVRKVCPKCSTLEDLTESEKKEFEEVINNLKNIKSSSVFEIPQQIPRTHGCETCSNTGYSGRIVVTEVITITSEIKNLILNQASSVDMIAAARKEGIITMREDGFIKVAQHHTTLEEVYRVTNII
ncbi:GspE/PulE family protein [Patescibacteria group bacterium]